MKTGCWHQLFLAYTGHTKKGRFLKLCKKTHSNFFWSSLLQNLFTRTTSLLSDQSLADYLLLTNLMNKYLSKQLKMWQEHIQENIAIRPAQSSPKTMAVMIKSTLSLLQLHIVELSPQCSHFYHSLARWALSLTADLLGEDRLGLNSSILLNTFLLHI